MKKKDLLILVLLGVFSLLLLFSMAVLFEIPADASKNMPVEIFFADHISPTHLLVIEEFNRIHQGKIKVVPVNLPFDKFSTNERKELLARALRSKSEKLDVFAVDLIWIPRFAKWSEPLDAYYKEEERSRLLSYSMQSCVYENRLVAVPMYIDIGMMYYRRDIIRRLPDAERVEQKLQSSINWEEIANLRRRLNYMNRPFFVFQGKDYEGLVCNFLEFFPGLNFQKGFDLENPGAQGALNMMVQLIENKTSPAEVVNFDENMSYQYMLDHDAVFVRGWPNFLENFRRFYPDSLKLNQIGRAPLPHLKGEGRGSVFGGWNLMISKTSKKKEAALEFVRFLESYRAQRMLFENGGYIPILNSIFQDSSYLKLHQELLFYHGILQKGFHRPALENYTQTSDILSYYLHKALKRELTPQKALSEARLKIQSKEVMIK